MLEEQDTIAAIATPLGEGGIGIVRISGPGSKEIGERILVKKSGPVSLSPRLMQHAYLVNAKGEAIDEVLAVFFKKPQSFTREDVLEIHAHGGILVLQRILEEILACGARLAQPGEFTKRAFLNGRIDLSQAEAVIDLIRAKSDAAANTAIKQLDGTLAAKISGMEERLYQIQAHLEAAIDFPEEEIPQPVYTEIKNEIEAMAEGIEELLKTARYGKILREGLTVVIIGRPNVGKSSLLNFFLQEERAIVTHIPGTTRDIIEETINFEGIPLRLIDTAGLRETDELVERIGIEKTKQYMEQAEITLFVLDAGAGLSREDREISGMIKSRGAIIVLNKADLPPRLPEEEAKELLPGAEIVRISLLRKTGLEELKQALRKAIGVSETNRAAELILTNTRHIHLLTLVRNYLKEALNSLRENLPEDLVAVDLKAALSGLGEITGKNYTPELLDQIFSRFCLGK